jgi:hypothetical protein
MLPPQYRQRALSCRLLRFSRQVDRPLAGFTDGKAAQFKTVPYGLQEITEADITETIARIKTLFKKMELRQDVLAELRTLRGKHA